MVVSIANIVYNGYRIEIEIGNKWITISIKTK